MESDGVGFIAEYLESLQMLGVLNSTTNSGCFRSNDLFRIPDVARDALYLPVVFVCISALRGTVLGLLQAVHLTARSHPNNQAAIVNFNLAEILKTHIHSYGGLTIFGFMLARLASTSGLLYISIVTPQQHCIPMYNFYIQPMVITFASIHSDFLGLSNSLTLK